MKQSKWCYKLISLILSFVLAFSSLPVSTAFAADKEIEKCTVCNGSGKVECNAKGCVRGKIESECPNCIGTGVEKKQCDLCLGSGIVNGETCTKCNGEGTVNTTCSLCNGLGKVSENCKVCNGTGLIDCKNCHGTGKVENEYEICPDCKGNKSIERDCSSCKGTGKIKVKCSTCNGNGKITVSKDCSVCKGKGKITKENVCENCNGTGSVDGVECEECSGTGKITKEVNCEVCNCSGRTTEDTSCESCKGSGEIEKTCEDCNGSGKIKEKCQRCSGKGKILTKNDDSFAFKSSSVSKIKVGQTFSNPASSEKNLTGKIIYSSSDDSIANVDENGNVTANKVGKVDIIATIETDYTYSSKKISYDLEVEKGIPVIENYSASSIDYMQKLQNSTFTNVSAKCGDLTVSGTAKWKDASIAPTVSDSDKTNYKAVFTPDDKENYESVEFDAMLIVNPIDIQGITVDGTNKVYDGQTIDAVKVQGTQPGDKVEYSVNGKAYSEDVPKIKNVEDTCSVSIIVKRNENYKVFSTSAEGVINPASVDGAKFEVYSGTYDGKEHEAVKVTNDVNNGENPVAYYLYNGERFNNCPKFVDAGTYEVTVVLNSNYQSDKNAQQVNVRSVISVRDAEVYTADRTETYNAKLYGADITKVTADNLADGDKLESCESTNAFAAVGEYQISVSKAKIVTKDDNKDVTKNYNITYNNGTLKINKRPVNITVKDVNAYYTASKHSSDDYVNPESRYTIVGLADGANHKEELNFAGEATAVGEYKDALDISSYKIRDANGDDVTDNYDVKVKKGSLKITYISFDFDKAYQYKVEGEGSNGWCQKVSIEAKNGYTICMTNNDASAFTKSIEYSTEGATYPEFAIKDENGFITAVEKRNEVKIDSHKPELSIEYSTPMAYKIVENLTLGFYKANETVKLKAKNTYSGINSISYIIKRNGKEDTVTLNADEISYDASEKVYYAKLVIPEKFKEQIISFSAKNESGLSASYSDNNVVVTDTKAPGIQTIEYKNSVKEVENKQYFSSNAQVVFNFDEDYFYKEYLDGSTKKNTINALENDVELEITKDAEEYYKGKAVITDEAQKKKFVADFDEEKKSISITIPSILNGENNDGDYIIKLKYTDLSDNTCEASSKTVVIDTTAPEVEIAYSDSKAESRKESGYFNDRTATITVDEHNFDKDAFDATVKARNIEGKEISDTKASKAISDHNKWESKGNTHTLTIPYEDEAKYEFALDGLKDYANNSYKIKAGNDSVYKKDTETPESFTVDRTGPSEVKIEYSSHIGELILKAVSFGFYKEKCKVTLTTTDETSGVQYFSYSYDVDDSVNSNNRGGKVEKAEPQKPDGNKFTYEFEIPAQFRGKVTASAIDNSGNYTDKETKGERTIVTDTISPEIKVSYPKADNIVNGVSYYNKNVDVEVEVTEENFMDGEYPSKGDGKDQDGVRDMIINAEIVDDQGQKENKEYQINNWTREKDDTGKETDKWKGSFTMENEGDYTLNINYSDKSGNAAEYVKKDITIDKTAPAIDITYSPSKNTKYTADKKYFSEEERTAAICVTEHNFDVSENYLKNAITVKDVNGKDIESSVLDKDIHGINNWTTIEGDANKHLFTFVYPADANYTFNIECQDYAKNNNKPVNYNNADAPREFTVDKTIPSDIKVGFEKTSLSKILNILTFGVFFNDEVKIKVEATDQTAGLWKSEISIQDSNGKEIPILDNKVSEFSIDKNDKSKGYAEYTITKNNLDKVKKFKGKLILNIFDMSGNVYMNTGTIDDGSIKLSNNEKAIDNESKKDINNYLVYENEESHSKYSSININVDKRPVSKETKQTSVDFKNYLKANYLKDAKMSNKDTAPLFSDNVRFTVDFTDEYSGIMSAKIIVYNNNSNKEYINSTYNFISDDHTSKNVLWSRANSSYNASIAERATAEFTINKNANDIVILAIITDNSGNVSYDYYNFGIDTTKPTIDYSFKTDGKNTANKSYNAKKTVFTVNVKERNFPKGNETVGTITYKVDGVNKSKKLKGKDFTAANNDVSYSDKQRYTYNLGSLRDEGQYENFEFKAVDRANNSSEISPKFTFYYDHTQPVISIKSDKFSGGPRNGYFYQNSRVITIAVKDRYFSEKMFKYNNNSGTYRFVSDSEAKDKYHTNKRTFIYTFTYTTNKSIDCSLTNFAASDKSGNKAENVPSVANASKFVVDGKKPQTFSAVVTTPKNKNGVNVGDNKYKVFVEENIRLSISCSDENLAHAKISNAILRCRELGSDGNTKTTNFKLAETSRSRNRITYSVANLVPDGFYDMSYTVTDDSGKVSDIQKVSFAICRKGALFDRNKLNEISKREKIYNENEVENIVFTQYSASSNTKAILKINDGQYLRKTLKEGKDYLVSGATQDKETLVYKSNYRLLRSAFELDDGTINDGIYTISIIPLTTDANNFKSEKAPITQFTVTLDATKPVLSAKLSYTTSYNKKVSGEEIENKGKYKFFSNSADVVFTLSDSYSKIDNNSIKVMWNDKELEVVPVSGSANTYRIHLTANNPSNGNDLKIYASDNAGNTTDLIFGVNINTYFWLYVAIAGFLLLGLLAIIIILIVRKRKSDKEEKAE